MTIEMSCGDGNWCGRCDNNNENATNVKTFRRNGLGRCDFYEGPGMKGIRYTIGQHRTVEWSEFDPYMAK